jgi:hypothetical protein
VINGNADPAVELPINAGAMAIDTDMFYGRVEVHLKGLKSTRPGFFDGKKRFFQVAVQGRFKRPVEAGAICLGQEFVKPGNVPAWVGEFVMTAASKVFSSSAHVNVHTKLPYFMNPVLAACQVRAHCCLIGVAVFVCVCVCGVFCSQAAAAAAAASTPLASKPKHNTPNTQTRNRKPRSSTCPGRARSRRTFGPRPRTAACGTRAWWTSTARRVRFSGGWLGCVRCWAVEAVCSWSR